MEKEFVSYAQALSLKELGFDEPCFGFFRNNHLLFSSEMYNCTVVMKEDMEYDADSLAPTYSTAFRWFREKHSSHSHVSKYKDNNFYHYDIFVDEVDEDGDECFETYPCNHLYDTYEEAESACLDKLIEIVKIK